MYRLVVLIFALLITLCQAGFFVPGEPAIPVAQCQIVISYPPGRPDLTSMSFSSGDDDCHHPEVAISVSLAALLRSELPATPVPKPHG